MSKRSICLIAFLIAGSGTACAADSARRVAESNVVQWNQAFAKGKVEEILSLYTDNAMLVQPNGAVSKNVVEIRAFWQNLIDKKAGVLSIDIVDAKGEKDDTIVTTSTLSDIKTLENPQQVMKYQYDGVLYSVLKRQSDGSWKAQVQHWSNKSKS